MPKLGEDVSVTDLVFYMAHLTSYHDKQDYKGLVKLMASTKKVTCTEAQLEQCEPYVKEWMEYIVPILRREYP